MTCSEFLLQSFRRSPIADIREWNGLGSIWVYLSDLRINMMNMMMTMMTMMTMMMMMMACTDTSIQINVGSFVKNSKLHLNAFQRSKKNMC